MSFSNRTAVQTYIDTYLNTNGTNSISGAELNTALTGLLQFIPEIGSYTATLSSGSTLEFTIPLSFTPIATFVQSYNSIVDDVVSFTFSSNPTTNGIDVIIRVNRESFGDYTFSYLAI